MVGVGRGRCDPLYAAFFDLPGRRKLVDRQAADIEQTRAVVFTRGGDMTDEATETKTTIATLNDHEKTRLQHCEAVISRGLSTFITTGAALAEIRASALYRATHATWGEYLREKWGMSRQRAHQIESATVVSRILRDADTSTQVDAPTIVQPETERQTRPLVRLKDEPEAAKTAWERAVHEADGMPTPAQVDNAVKAVEAELAERPGKRPADRAHAALTSNESCEWWTPKRYVDAARAAMGGAIDLDPASCAEANETVGATRYYTRADDGLSQQWHGRVWLNCPRSKHDPQSRSHAVWVRHLLTEFALKRVTAAVTIVNVATGDPWFQPLWGHALCFCSHRVKHIDGDNSGSGKDRPTHSSVFVGVGVDEQLWVDAFRKFGTIVLPYQDGVSEVVK